MKMIIALALVAIVAAGPVTDVEPIPIVHSEFEKAPEGSYNYKYETGNGIFRDEVGELKDVLNEENKPTQVITVRGSFRYVSPDGKEQNVSFYADQTGYHAEGDSIPKSQTR